ncbi:chromosome partitioning protein ParB [Mageeibacillus indolicus]|uniref:Chromosome partitioning protein ParB n=1 Tax=Mageeibacillus indolicus TaxID=884684 RepID=A0A2J8B0Z5_9FIRM|nr:ParB/RepB/Spo0J family partition protein [Mageeibacillus indolicus]PNH18453.1 chromosome partitioning protein ParB [Mageeibacillus indolicus]
MTKLPKGEKNKFSGLGRGLGALLNNEATNSLLRETDNQNESSSYKTNDDNNQRKESLFEKNKVYNVNINFVMPNENQPRKFFDKIKLEELANSIKNNGIIQPILVTKVTKDKYKIIAGERRWRAARLLGLKEVPILIRELTESEVLEQALIENIQRQDLNAIEEAEALTRLMDEHKLTQEEVSARVGKSRSSIANTLRLLSLPQSVQSLVIQDDLSAGHARALVAIKNEELQLSLAEEAINKDLSVRDIEKKIKKALTPPKEIDAQSEAYRLSLQEIEDLLTKSLGTKVQLREKNNKGRIVISYYSADDRERILEILENNNN